MIILDAARDVNQRLERLLGAAGETPSPAETRWGVRLTYAEVKDRALDWDTLLRVWDTRSALFKRMERYGFEEDGAKEALHYIRLNANGEILLYNTDKRPSRCWQLSQAAGGGVLSVAEQALDDGSQLGALRTLATVDTWCDFMREVQLPPREDKVAERLYGVCCSLMVAHYSGPEWTEVGKVHLRWDRLVQFLQGMSGLVGGLNWFFNRRGVVGAGDWFSAAEVESIRTRISGCEFKSSTTRTGVFSYGRAPLVEWDMSCGPEEPFVLAVRRTPPHSETFRTVRELRDFLMLRVFSDAYFASTAKGKMPLGCDLTDYLMQQFRWW
jgi:hypothetical protein